MSKAFDRAWNIAKSENVYHSVQINARNDEEAQRISDMEWDMLNRGISFDTGSGMGGRDWELDFSLKGATPDEVMTELRATGIPFQTRMWVDEAGEHGKARWTEGDPDYEDGGTIIGSWYCPECNSNNAQLIQESPEMGGGITLGCNECGFTDPDFEGVDDDGEGMVA